jgi:hypothetical protein
MARFPKLACVAAIPQWLAAVGTVYIALAGISALLLIVDLARRPQPMAVMNAVWPITALYLGPIALWSYAKLARTGAPWRALPHWQAIVIEATHCGAGCSLGDIIAETALFLSGIVLFKSTLLTSFIGDFTLAYIFGIAFQYFAIVPMRGLSFWAGIRAAIAADTVSLTAFEIGLFFSMWLMTLLPFHHLLTPATTTFWFLMQLGMIVGFCTSYPANWWLVRAGVKEIM